VRKTRLCVRGFERREVASLRELTRSLFEAQGKQEANAGDMRRITSVGMTGQVATALRGEGFVGAESKPAIRETIAATGWRGLYRPG
jgi:hypothetical protein